MRVRKLKSSSSELERLKNLLLSDELEKLSLLESKLKVLTFQSEDEDEIISRITPLFDKILLARLKSRDQKTIDILSDYLADIIAQSSQKDPERLSQALRTILSTAVSEEIASNKDAMIDSLYPIMGGMVSKYVSTAIKEFIENINKKIDDGLSLDRYKRKIKSKLSGVSESELLLQESTEAQILSLFIIQRESGLLIGEAHVRNRQITDPHMVASMASAIKDFINDWIERNQEQTEIQLLSYGSSTLYIESAGSVYLIAFLDAEPDQEQRMEINQFFASLIRQYMDFFQNFDGDDSSSWVKSLNMQMEAYLDKQNVYPSAAQRSDSQYAQYIGFALFALFMIAIAYLFVNRVYEYSMETEIYNRTKEVVTIDIDHKHVTVEGNINALHNIKTIESIIKHKSRKSIINRLTVPAKEIGRMFLEQRSIIDENLSHLSSTINSLREDLGDADRTIALLSRDLNQQAAEAETREERFISRDRSVRELSNLRKKIGKMLNRALASIPYFDPDGSKLILPGKLLFIDGKAILRRNPEIESVIDQYFDTLLDDKQSRKYMKSIIISIYRDNNGSLEQNTRVSEEMASMLKEYLSKLDVMRKRGSSSLLISTGYAERDSAMKKGIEDRNASNRIEIEFQLDTKQMEDDINQLINRYNGYD